MRIAIVSDFPETVPPEKYGGTELVVSNITEELVRRGHQVTLFAPKGSKTKAVLQETLDGPLRKMGLDDRHSNAVRTIAIGNVAALLKEGDFDIIHNHVGWRLLALEKMIGIPMVTTLHNPFDSYQKFVYGKFLEANYVSISLSQREKAPALNFVANVYNGIDIHGFQFSEKKGEYFAFLGRISPEKGPKEAIVAAKKAGVKLKMAAKVDAADQEYFTKEIKPLIDGKQIEYIGEVNAKEKNTFLAGATALLAPIQWDEPFGLFFVEAMATGTPVITFARGSVPEIIKPETGFAIDPKDVDGLVEALKKIQDMPEEEYKAMRRRCREHVEQHFTSEKMAEAYEKVYEKIVNKKAP